jgi:hypothetical protein
MKKKVLITILTLYALNAFCQFFPEGEAIWTSYSADVFATTRNFQFIQTGDTLINENFYQKMYYSYEAWDDYADTLLRGKYKEYKGAIRPVNSEKKVYYIPKDSSTEVLLYDFNLELGDTIPVWHDNFPNPKIVRSIDTIIVGGEQLKRFKIGNSKSDTSIFGNMIIEGIGSIKELLYIDNHLEGFYGFKCFWNKDTDFNYPENCKTITLSTNELMESKINFQVIPNPCFNYFTISTQEIRFENFWFNLTDINGNILLHQEFNSNNHRINLESLSSGLYFLLVYNKTDLIYNEKIVKIK